MRREGERVVTDDEAEQIVTMNIRMGEGNRTSNWHNYLPKRLSSVNIFRRKSKGIVYFINFYLDISIKIFVK